MLKILRIEKSISELEEFFGVILLEKWTSDIIEEMEDLQWISFLLNVLAWLRANQIALTEKMKADKNNNLTLRRPRTVKN
jgi:ABC-type enterochelin transport system permease subunit